MDVRLYKFIQSNKKNDEIFKTFLTHLIQDSSNFDLIFTNLKEIAFRYITENYKIEFINDNGHIQSFSEYLRTYDYDLYLLLMKFQEIRSEVIAVLMKAIMVLHNYDNLFLLILMMKPKDIERYLPGICNFCFSTLEKYPDPRIINILTYVIYQQVEINKTSEEIITNYFFKSNEKQYHIIWYVIILRCKIFKEHFIGKLLINDFYICEEWYKVVNDNIEELFSFELIHKLIEKDKFEFNHNVFDKLRESYLKDGKNEDLIIKIQDKYFNLIKNPVIELKPVSSINFDRLTTCGSSDTIRKYLKRVDLDKHGFSIVKMYLTVDKEFIINVIEDLFDVKELILKHDNRFFEWLFVNIEQQIFDYESIYDEIYRFNNKDDCCDQVVLSNLLKDKIFVENEIRKFLKAVKIYIEVLNNANIDDIIYSLLSILHIIDDFYLSYEIFLLLKILLNKEHELKQSLLQHIFDEIIYYDIDNVKIRILKYDIFNILLLRWFVFERKLKAYSSFNQLNLDWNYLKTIHKPSCNLLKTHENNEFDSKSFDKNNILVLCSRIWEEIKEKPEDKEINSIVDLMTTIITLTGRFYQRRLLESFLINEIFNHLKTIRHEESSFRYVNFIEKMIMNFNLTKNSPVLIFDCVKNISQLINDRHLLNLLIKKHPLYAEKMLKESHD